jgi:hypothetical protein
VNRKRFHKKGKILMKLRNKVLTMSQTPRPEFANKIKINLIIITSPNQNLIHMSPSGTIGGFEVILRAKGGPNRQRRERITNKLGGGIMDMFRNEHSVVVTTDGDTRQTIPLGEISPGRKSRDRDSPNIPNGGARASTLDRRHQVTVSIIRAQAVAKEDAPSLSLDSVGDTRGPTSQIVRDIVKIHKIGQFGKDKNIVAEDFPCPRDGLESREEGTSPILKTPKSYPVHVKDGNWTPNKDTQILIRQSLFDRRPWWRRIKSTKGGGASRNYFRFMLVDPEPRGSSKAINQPHRLPEVEEVTRGDSKVISTGVRLDIRKDIKALK